MSRFSVKKPFTVLVGVILVIVLGVVSFTRMSTDLLPSMNLPYVIAVTTYPGASPEKVEASVTKPLESALATTSGIKNVTSSSSENASMIMLEFTQGTNMDAAMIELSNSINTVEAYLDDAVGTPMLIKISPDLLPIMVAGVDKDGLDETELSKFVNDKIIPELEKVEGVASVEAMGLIEEEISVKLNEDKIDDINDKLLKTVNKELYKAKQKIDDGLKQISDGKAKLKEGEKTLNNESSKGADALAAASAQVDAAIASVSALQSQQTILSANKQAYTAELEGMKTLKQSKDMLNQLSSGIVSGIFGQKMQAEGLTPSEIQALNTQMTTALQNPVGYISENVTDAEFTVIYSQIIASVNGVPDNMKNMSRTDFVDTVTAANNAEKRIDEINTELNNIKTQQATLTAMKKELDKNAKTAQQAYEKLEGQKISASSGITDGKINISSTRQSLDTAEAELKKAQTEYEASRETALEKADLSGGLTADTISKILQAQNFSMPAGSIEEDGMEQHTVKVGDTYKTLDEIKNTVLMYVNDDIGNVRLKDIADISITNNEGENYAKIDSNSAIMFTVQKQSTASTADVSDALNEQIKSLQQEHSGLKITSLMDQGTYIHIVINSVLQNLLLGGLLAVIVLALFLKDVKPTIVIAFSIPISLLFAIALMFFTGVTLNIISLSGLALGVGMLVDNSIVVIENIYRLRNEGMTAIKAAIKGAKEVAGAIAASTLTTICVFAPIVFTEGMSRDLFTDMGLTIAYSLVASLVVALTVVPAMGATVLRSTKEKKHGIFDAIVNVYEKMLRFSLKYKVVPILLAVVLLAFSLFEVTQMGTAFMPESEENQIQAATEFDSEYTKQEVRDITDDILAEIQKIEGVKTVGVMEGSGSSMLGGSSTGNSMSYYLELEKKRTNSNKDIEKKILEITDDYNCETSVTSSNMDMSALGGAGVSVSIKGADLEKIYKISDDLAEKLKSVEGLENISNGREGAGEQTFITINKAKAMKHGLTVAQIYQSVAGSLANETKSTTVTIDEKDYPIVISEPIEKITQDNIMDYKVSYTDTKTGDSKKIKLEDIADKELVESPLSISRDNGQRTLAVTADVDADHNIGLVSRDVEKIIADYDIPDGYTVEIEGENETINSTMKDLMLMLLLAVIFIYLIMVAQFQSLVSPFIVIFTIPLAITGGLLGLWITGSELSVVAVIGFLVLAGVVVNNGIVFVDYANKLRERGYERRESLVLTGKTRIRPILMTALTTILAMVTMAMGIGEGADMTAPIGIVVIGGLSYATLLTLFIVPVLYDIFASKKIRKLKLEEEELSNSDLDK